MMEKAGNAAEGGQDAASAGYGVYLHIPFCKRKCLYCDFPSKAGVEGLMERYTDALIKEIRTVGALEVERRGVPKTIYIGGGTPSYLTEDLAEKLLRAIRSIFIEEDFPHAAKMEPSKAEEPEYTIECNPGTVSLEKLKLYRFYGANRLSFGVQSFDDKLLKRIGRIHTAMEAARSIHSARIAGFTDISLDLMYGLPGETLDDFRHDLQAMTAIAPTHVSVYGLILEPATLLERLVKEGRVTLPTEEDTEAMYDLMTDFLPANGYQRYEISSFAQPHHESHHNLGYWHDAPYLGLGAAAHSYLDGRRQHDEEDIAAYIEAIEQDRPVHIDDEEMSEKYHMEEFCFLALRTTEGLSKTAFETTFHAPVTAYYEDTIRSMEMKGLLEESGDHFRLTEKGMKYGNVVFEAFLLP